MEEYQTTWPAILEILKSNDCKETLETIGVARAKCAATIKNNPVYADFHAEVKVYYVEKLLWRELFKNHAFPGIKPRPIADAVTSNAQAVTSRGSESTGDKNTPIDASAAKGKSKSNMPKADPSPAGRSNTFIAGETSAQGKVNTPRAQSQAATSSSDTFETVSALSLMASLGRRNSNRNGKGNSKEVNPHQARGQGARILAPTSSMPARSHPTSRPIPSPSAAAHGPTAPPKFRSSQEPMLMRPNGHPRFSHGPVEYQNAMSWLIGPGGRSIKAVENHFPGVRVRTGKFGSDLFFYAEPWSINDKDNKLVLEECNHCFWFLESYGTKFTHSKTVVRLFADEYLSSSDWVRQDPVPGYSDSHYQTESAKSKNVVSPSPQVPEISMDAAIKSEQGLEVSTLTEATPNLEPEPSTGKRKRTIIDLDALPLHESALTEQTKRLKLEQSPPLEKIKQLWDRPRYGISAPLNPEAAGLLLNRKAAAEKHFGVRFHYGLYKNELIFYCQPVDINNIPFSDAIELCDLAFRFLNEFLRNSYGQSGCVDDYLKSSDWVTKEKEIEKISTSNADTHLQGRSERNQ
ncbi:hypothetical protein EAF04_003563 [Stromatinia cepivora]|nr:hypothetical protein EAF04_003563 [Stromatinia cepivora]